MLRTLTHHCRTATTTTTLTTTTTAIANRAAIQSYQQWTRSLASGKSKARRLRLRGPGGIPGPKYVGNINTELTYRTDSVLESVRRPTPVVNPIKRWRIVRGDFVEVISGPEKGKRGRILEVIRASNSVLVEGANYVTQNIPLMGTERKKKIETEAPIYVSRVAIVCPQTDMPSKIGYRFLEDGTKVRIATRSGAIIPRPDILRQRRKPRGEDTPKDTPPTVVLQKTYNDEDGLYDDLQGFESVVQITPNTQQDNQ